MTQRFESSAKSSLVNYIYIKILLKWEIFHFHLKCLEYNKFPFWPIFSKIAIYLQLLCCHCSRELDHHDKYPVQTQFLKVRIKHFQIKERYMFELQLHFSRKERPTYLSKKELGMPFWLIWWTLNYLPIQLKRSDLTIASKFGKFRG